MGRFRVAQPEAVEELFEKIEIRARDNPNWHRLTRAARRARARFGEVGAADARGFYHGLLTGYAVAFKVLQGKVTGVRPT